MLALPVKPQVLSTGHVLSFHFQGVGSWPSVDLPNHLDAKPFMQQELLPLENEEILQDCEGANTDR